jgi:hypothetical protein
MNLDPALFEAEMNFGFGARPDLLGEAAFPTPEPDMTYWGGPSTGIWGYDETTGESGWLLPPPADEADIRHVGPGPSRFVNIDTGETFDLPAMEGYGEEMPDMFQMPAQMGGMFIQHAPGPGIETDQAQRQDMMSPVLFQNTSAAMASMFKGGESGYIGFEHVGTYVDREVRGMEGTGQMSAHARGDAIDITGFYMDVGTDEPVFMSVASASPEIIEAWKESLSPYFSTILGPGDRGHDTHLHLEVAGGPGITAAEQRRMNVLPGPEPEPEPEEAPEPGSEDPGYWAETIFEVPAAFTAAQEPLLGVIPAVEDIPYDPDNPSASPFGLDESEPKRYGTGSRASVEAEILRRYQEGILNESERLELAQGLVDEHTDPRLALTRLLVAGSIGYGDFIAIKGMIPHAVQTPEPAIE